MLLSLACVAMRGTIAATDAAQHGSHQGGRVFELSNGADEGGEGFLLGEGEGTAAEEALGKGTKIAFDYDVEQAAKQDVAAENERRKEGIEEYVPAQESAKVTVKRNMQKYFSDKELSKLGGIFSERAEDAGAAKMATTPSMKPVEQDAAFYLDPKDVEKYRSESAMKAAQVEVESALDSTYRHQSSHLGKAAVVKDDGDMTRKWVLPTDVMPSAGPRSSKTWAKEAVNEKQLNKALKKTQRIKRQPKMMHKKQDYRKKIQLEVDMFRHGSIHKLLRLRHRFMLKDPPTLEATREEDALKQLVVEDEREIPEKKLKQNIDDEILEVKEEIEDTKKPDPKPVITKPKDLDANEKKCLGNSKPDGFVAEQLKPLAQGTLSTQVVIKSCDDVAKAGLCRSKRSVKVAMNATTMPKLDAKYATPDTFVKSKNKEQAYTSSYTSESAPGANPAKTFPVKYLMSIWCELSCHFGACDNQAEQIIRNYKTQVAKSSIGQEIADDQRDARADYNTQNIIFQIEKDRAARLAQENADEKQAKSVKSELDHQAELAKEKSIKAAVANQTKGGIGGGKLDLASYQAHKITEYLTSLKFLSTAKGKFNIPSEMERIPMEAEEEIHLPPMRHPVTSTGQLDLEVTISPKKLDELLELQD